MDIFQQEYQRMLDLMQELAQIAEDFAQYVRASDLNTEIKLHRLKEPKLQKRRGFILFLHFCVRWHTAATGA